MTLTEKFAAGLILFDFLAIYLSYDDGPRMRRKRRQIEVNQALALRKIRQIKEAMADQADDHIGYVRRLGQSQSESEHLIRAGSADPSLRHPAYEELKKLNFQRQHP